MSESNLIQSVMLSALPKQRELSQLSKHFARSVFFTILAACITSMLLGLGFYMLYIGLSQAGLAPFTSLGIIAGFATCALVICMLLAHISKQRLQDVAHAYSPNPLGKLDEVLSAFIDGLLSSDRSRTHTREKDEHEQPSEDDGSQATHVIKMKPQE